MTNDEEGGPRIWNRGDIQGFANLVLKGAYYERQQREGLSLIVDLMKAAEAPLAHAGVERQGEVPVFASNSASPRVWSRDDFMAAAAVAETGLAKGACAVLAHAEKHARLVVTQPRDAKGHFAKPPPPLSPEAP